MHVQVYMRERERELYFTLVLRVVLGMGREYFMSRAFSLGNLLRRDAIAGSDSQQWHPSLGLSNRLNFE